MTVTYKNHRGQTKTREFTTNQAMQDWLRTVGDQIEVILTTLVSQHYSRRVEGQVRVTLSIIGKGDGT